MLVKLYKRKCQSFNYKIRENGYRPRAFSSLSQQRKKGIPWSKPYFFSDNRHCKCQSPPLTLGFILFCISEFNIWKYWNPSPFLCLAKSTVAMSLYLRFLFKKRQSLHWQWWNFWCINWTWNLFLSTHRVKMPKKKKSQKVQKILIDTIYYLSFL